MKHTNRQTPTRTLTDLYRALDHSRAVTITYVKEDGTETVRTLELIDIHTTKNGAIIARAMDREDPSEPKSFRVDRILSYTVSRSTHQVDVPADDTETPDPTAPVHSAAALIAFELERDTITAAHKKMRLVA